jgi:hypothetical protein
MSFASVGVLIQSKARVASRRASRAAGPATRHSALASSGG